MSRRRRVPGWLLALLFLGIPIVEIAVLIQVGQVIGPWWTILLMVLSAVVGAWLVKREGRRTVQALSTALRAGRMPAREIADGILVLVGGTLMLTPGFVTDLVGILVILPLTRPLARGLLTRAVAARLVVGGPGLGGTGLGGTGFGASPGGQPGPPRRPASGDVVEGEVVDDDRDRP